jgi:aspartate/methionine/tyrosine aminotransferase
MIELSQRAKIIRPFYVMELLEKAKELEKKGEDIVHMEIGEPDLPSPEAVKNAAKRAIEENHTFYTQSLGLWSLRERISQYYQEKEKVAIPPERIIITNGTSGAFFLLFASLLEEGKTLGISDPGYPCYKNFCYLMGGSLISIEVTEETRFEITPHHLENAPAPPDILIVANPSNPTGLLYRRENLKEISDWLKKRGKVLVVDEIYSELIYEDRAATAFTISDDIVIINGFSKCYAMTGWRLGWMIAPDFLIRPIHKIAQNVFISPPSISQYAALEAFDAVDELERMKETYRQRRNFLLPELKRLGFNIPVDPQGAFYIYAGIERWGLDSMIFVEKALQEAGVALTPGYDFGNFRADSHIRFSYANSMERLKEGIARLETWIGSL